MYTPKASDAIWLAVSPINGWLIVREEPGLGAWARVSLGQTWTRKSKREIERQIFKKKRKSTGRQKGLQRNAKGKGKGKDEKGKGKGKDARKGSKK